MRTTRSPGGDKAGPDYYWGWPNLCSLRIFDPAGKLVKFVDLGKQSEAVKSYEVELPAGPAGVWRFSVANGSNDRYRIEFPDTPVWGVRGEMVLGVGKQFPKELYLYVPESAELLICESFGNAAPEFEADGRPLEGELKKLGRSWKRLVPDIPRGGTVRVKLGRMSGKAFAIDGMPGLLCPTPEAAAKLKGGLVEESGALVAGPLQARARRLVAGFKPEDFELNLDFPGKVPAGLENPQLEAVLYGKYGASGMLIPASRLQITDPASRWCGALIAPEKRGELSERNNFLANRQRAYFDAGGAGGHRDDSGEAERRLPQPGRREPCRDRGIPQLHPHAGGRPAARGGISATPTIRSPTPFRLCGTGAGAGRPARSAYPGNSAKSGARR